MSGFRIPTVCKINLKLIQESQKRIQTMVPGFKYNLGFSGGVFKTGNYDEQIGDEELLANRHRFWWFPHMYQVLLKVMYQGGIIT